MEQIQNDVKEPAKQAKRSGWRMPFWTVPVAYFLVELFGFAFLQSETVDWWPLAFGVLWAILLTGLVRALPTLAGRILFGIT